MRRWLQQCDERLGVQLQLIAALRLSSLGRWVALDDWPLFLEKEAGLDGHFVQTRAHRGRP